MPLITCRECGAEISSLAKVCPRCGGPPTAALRLQQTGDQMTRIGCAMTLLFTLPFLALLLFGLLGGCRVDAEDRRPTACSPCTAGEASGAEYDRCVNGRLAGLRCMACRVCLEPRFRCAVSGGETRCDDGVY
jgi:ribosomal protein L40E